MANVWLEYLTSNNVIDVGGEGSAQKLGIGLRISDKGD
jgi:hypothetical protein